MNITITGSLGNIGQRLTRALTAGGHRVTVVSHTPARAESIRQLHAIPAIGSVDDPAFLLQAFRDADAVYTMIPPGFAAADIRAYMKAAGDGYAAAIRESGVRHVVNLSSIGAHLPHGPGPAGANHYVENRLNSLEDVHVLHLRPGMFYTNFFGNMEMIRHQHIIGNNFGGHVKMVLSHPGDIADTAAEALDTLSFTGKSVRYVAGDEKSGTEIAAALGSAIGQPDLAWAAFPDEAMLEGLMQNGFTKEMATVYVIEVGAALRNGVLFDDYRRHAHEAAGTTRLASFAEEFALAYQQAR